MDFISIRNFKFRVTDVILLELKYLTHFPAACSAPKTST